MVNGKTLKWLKVKEYLEVNMTRLRRNIFACTNFCKCRSLDILRGFNFTNERDFTPKYTEKSGAIL